MRKSVLLFLSLSLVLLLAGIAQASFEVYAVRAKGEITIDGDLSDWNKTKPINLNSLEFMSIGSTNRWGGPKDLSATVYVMWDDYYLYFAAVVSDNVVMQEHTGANIWIGDTLEVYLAVDGMHPNRTAYSRADFQFGFTPGTDAKAPAWHLWTNTSEIYDLDMAAVRTETGYVLEIALGLDQLGLFPDGGMEIGFDVAINDVDITGVSGAETQLKLSGSSEGWRNPSVFQWLLFLD